MILKGSIKIFIYNKHILLIVAIIVSLSGLCYDQSNAVDKDKSESIDSTRKINNYPLTLEERITCQEIIENIYWEHRIWPKENQTQKPDFETMMPDEKIKEKVIDSLKKSNVLDYYWKNPITGAQLQAEIERIANDTKKPEILKEIWHALGDNPYIAAECMARPILADRLLRKWYAYDQRFNADLKKKIENELSEFHGIDQLKLMSGKYTEIEYIKSSGERGNNKRESVKMEPLVLSNTEWGQLINNLSHAFQPDRDKEEQKKNFASDGMISHKLFPEFGAYYATEIHNLPLRKISDLQENEEYFSVIAIIEKDINRIKIAGVKWRKMLFDIWWQKTKPEILVDVSTLKFEYRLPSIKNDGCTDDTWQPIGLEPREGHSAVWTGTEMIIWGGYGEGYYTTGWRYDPAIDYWHLISQINAPSERDSQTVVWTGSEMIIWGGEYDNSHPGTGGRYNPSTDTWTATSQIDAPSVRVNHSAVWTGTEMIIWGGEYFAGAEMLNTGGRYNPGTDTWVPTSLINVPDARMEHTAVWTGIEMIIWGGSLDAAGGYYANTGAKYNPITDSWVSTSLTNVPIARHEHTAIWTGTEMIAWGGNSGYLGDYLQSGGKYDPVMDSWVATSLANAPSPRHGHTAVWAGSEMIIWGGKNGNPGDYLQTGGKYNPVIDSWIPTSLNNAPSSRALHTAIWTGTEMIIWGGHGWLNTGARYNPSTDIWIPTSLNNRPAARAYHVAIWTGTEMIIWGGYYGIGTPIYYDTGARYDLIADSWIPTSLINVPEGRITPSAVWTGKEMIVWGGHSEYIYFNSGGKYNPLFDSWTPTSLLNAPSPRTGFSTVWTGSEMIIWGGGYWDYNNEKDILLNSGGRYNLSSNTWKSTTFINAPIPREYFTAVWTGEEMIIWGGEKGISYCDDPHEFLNSGKKYNPSTNSWAPITSFNAPSPRVLHSAIWTGSEMLIWGGENWCNNEYFVTGGRYNPGTNSWTPISTANAASARAYHTALWSGSEMLIWGGIPEWGSGGKYDPYSDSWSMLPWFSFSYWQGHSAIWTGSVMIIWGGGNYYDTGGRYCRSVPSFISLQPYLLRKPAVYDYGSITANGIIEPDEQITLLGRIQNIGTAHAFNTIGTLSTTDPISIIDPHANYGTILSSSDAFCSHCYKIQAPSTNRPSYHWDFNLMEQVSADGHGPASFTYTYHVGDSFSDVQASHFFYSYIESLLHSGVISGCTNSAYCPDALVQRGQLAKFACQAMNTYSPGACPVTSCAGIFADVSNQNIFCSYIEALYDNGIISGCSSAPLSYCPNSYTQRQQMAKILCQGLATINPELCIASSCTGIFADVNSGNPFCAHIEGLYNAGIVAGCTSTAYCPNNFVNRAQMAKFVVSAFGFAL